MVSVGKIKKTVIINMCRNYIVTDFFNLFIIKKVYYSGKMVITATQMLESMTENPRPTRAEATDVANAIYDGTTAIMLSGESAAGSYPLEAVTTMAKIAERAEQDINYDARLLKRSDEQNEDVTTAISHACCTMAKDVKASAIITVTMSGFTASTWSSFRIRLFISSVALFVNVTARICLYA